MEEYTDNLLIVTLFVTHNTSIVFKQDIEVHLTPTSPLPRWGFRGPKGPSKIATGKEGRLTEDQAVIVPTPRSSISGLSFPFPVLNASQVPAPVLQTNEIALQGSLQLILR